MTVHNRLDDAFASAREQQRAALLPYLTAGYPDRERFVDLATAVLDAGGDILELGVPFSDPLLDGPLIQRSQHEALEAGVTPADCLRLAAEIRGRSEKPLVFMGVYNTVLAYGPDRFCREAARSGVTGLIITDLPLEEQEEMRRAAAEYGLHLVQMVAPTSSPERLRSVCANASGFIYGISVAGITGPRASVADTARPLVERVRACTNVPVAVGFGIAGPQQAREVAAFADGVAVGSALIKAVAEAGPEERIPAARAFVAELRSALESAAIAS
jgi:tryptophan synthase alpha chain